MYRITCHNNQTQKAYDVTELSTSVQYATSLNGQPGKLAFTLREPPDESVTELFASNDFAVANGSIVTNGTMVKFEADGRGVFLGYIFKMGADESGSYKITAYDQMRYLKYEDVKHIPPMTASDAFAKICRDAGIRHEVRVPSRLVTPEYYHAGKTLYDMIMRHIQWANSNERDEDDNPRQYFIRDDFGTLIFSEISYHKTNAVIGDKSLLTGYQYEASIDKDTYNIVKVYRENEKTGLIDTWVAMDSENQAKWGKLQMLHKADDKMSAEQIADLAKRFLAHRNRETRTVKLNVLASASGAELMPETLVAGSGFKLSIEKPGLEMDTWIESATHTFTNAVHTISMEVFVP